MLPNETPQVATEIDLNLLTEANRVIYVINEIIRRAKLVGLLKEFIKEDGAALKNILEPNHLRNVMQSCGKYNIQRQMSLATSGTTEIDSADVISVFSHAASEYSRADSISSAQNIPHKIRGDTELTKILYVLEENREVQKLIKKRENDISPTMKTFIKILTEYRNRMEVRLTENAHEYRERVKYLNETFEKNQKAREEIARLEEELVVTKTDANICLIGKNILLNRHQNKLEKIKQAAQEVIERKVKESQKAMVNDWKQSVQEQERLKTAYQQATEKYHNILKDHLAAEKLLRAKRAKVENQVLGWIQKFDQDVSEKQAEEEQIQALLDKENDEVNEIQKKLDDQEEDYEELMQEKAEFEEEILERRLRQFILYRSARRIQRSYRLYRMHKMLKKSAKKGKREKKGKKKKEE